MTDVNFKDIRVLPGQLELKGNNAKTLADLVHQLQSGSTLKGLVVGTTAKSEVIFHTSIGRFISPNPLGLVRGDTITIRLANEGEDILGTILKVNQESPDLKSPINLAFVRDSNNKNTNINNQHNSSTISAFSDIGADLLPETIRGNISYFNLSKIDSGTLLYKTLINNFDTNSNQNFIEFKVLPKTEMLGGQLQIMGEILPENNIDSKNQMLRTPFGIITIENTQLQKGQNLSLEIFKINNYTVENSVKDKLTEFVIKLNSSADVLKKLDIAKAFASKNTNATSKGSQNNDLRTMLHNSQKQNYSSAQQIQQTSGNPKNADYVHLDKMDAISQKTQNILNQNNSAAEKKLANTAQLLDTDITKNTITKSTQSSEGAQNSKITPQEIRNNITRVDSSNAKNIDQQLSSPNTDKTINSNLPDEIITNAKIAGESSKIVEEFVKSGILASNLRIGTRKLKQNHNPDLDHAKSIDKLGEQEEAGKASSNRYQSRSFNALLKNMSEMDTVKKLSTELLELKEIFTSTAVEQQDPDHWTNVFIPFYNTKEVYEQEVKLNYPKKGILRFLVNTKLQMIGEIQLDGLIKYSKNIQNPTSFDLIVRSKDRLDPLLQRSINRIYATNQDITGIRGKLLFNDDEKFK